MYTNTNWHHVSLISEHIHNIIWTTTTTTTRTDGRVHKIKQCELHFPLNRKSNTKTYLPRCSPCHSGRNIFFFYLINCLVEKSDSSCVRGFFFVSFFCVLMAATDIYIYIIVCVCNFPTSIHLCLSVSQMIWSFANNLCLSKRSTIFVSFM